MTDPSMPPPQTSAAPDSAAGPHGPAGTPPSGHVYTLADFDYLLPPELIAQHPAPQRSASRLLDGSRWPPVDRVFTDLPQRLQPGDLMVFNDTQVIKARLLGRKDSGGAVEVLVERVLPAGDTGESAHTVWAHLRSSKSPRPGSRVWLGTDAPGGGFVAQVLGRAGPQDSLFVLAFPSDPFALLQQHGHVPLPPYITHADDADDVSRYQTVFARRPGAVAAPTAALHFDEALLQDVRARGVELAHVTLHVGAGTFQPVRSDNLAEHQMHTEWFEVPQATVDAIARTRARGGRVVAIGTTTLRALESAARHEGGLRAGASETDLFITPGYGFRVVDAMVTNFHLPRSTLMMLVSAFAGHAHIMALYQHAVAQRYRFFSYGDAMWLVRRG